MNYEMDFIGINKEARDADAICFRFYDVAAGRYIICVYDGGTSDYGEALGEHLSKYYFEEHAGQTIDFVICSHSDLDHASGLSIILENFKVNNLVMNRPWLYIDELFDKVDDGRITKESLEKRLREKYPYIDNLEKVASDNNVQIYEAFTGTTINNRLTVLSPTKDFYIELLVESDKTPLSENSTKKGFLNRVVDTIASAIETWTGELLREDVKTTAENEMCIVIHGEMDDESFLLTGDAGIRALNAAVDYSETNGIALRKVRLHQIPHHGSRHNVSPTILNDLIGPVVSEGSLAVKTAIVSVSKGSNHPRKMVTNAYIRRGVNVYEARENTILHSHGTPEREGWASAKSLTFSEDVEDWD